MSSTVRTDGLDRDRLVTEHLYLVPQVTHRFKRNFASRWYGEIESSAQFGLVRAADRYDPEKGPFPNYAVVRMVGEIKDGLRTADHLSRHTRRIRTRLKNLSPMECERLSTEELAESVGCSVGVLQRVQALLLYGSGEVVSLEELLEDGLNKEPSSTKGCEEEDQLLAILDAEVMLGEAFLDLADKERQVLWLYYFDDRTMSDIGQEMGLHESRVSQLHKKAIERLRKRLMHVR